MIRSITLALALAIAGCTTAEIHRSTDGSLDVSFTRLWTDTGLSVRTPEGLELIYTSTPDSMASDRVLDAFLGGRLRATE